MPVGQAVMATMRVTSLLGVLLSDASGAGVVSVIAAGAVAFLGAAFTTFSTSSTISSFVAALRSAAVKSFFTNARASLDKIFRCSLPPPAGAAMRNTRLASPSGPPKFTAGSKRANASVGWVTASERQCGMATPPGTPVSDFASRARASPASTSAEVARPAP